MQNFVFKIQLPTTSLALLLLINYTFLPLLTCFNDPLTSMIQQFVVNKLTKDIVTSLFIIMSFEPGPAMLLCYVCFVGL